MPSRWASPTIPSERSCSPDTHDAGARSRISLGPRRGRLSNHRTETSADCPDEVLLHRCILSDGVVGVESDQSGSCALTVTRRAPSRFRLIPRRARSRQRPAASAVVVVDLVWMTLCRVGPVAETSFHDPLIDVVEVGFADEEGVVLARDRVGGRGEVQADAVRCGDLPAVPEVVRVVDAEYVREPPSRLVGASAGSASCGDGAGVAPDLAMLGGELRCSGMSGSMRNDDAADWSPATSEPGELYTIEGRIRAIGSFARGLKNRDPRVKAYRRSMRRAAFMVCAVAGGIIAAVAVVAALVN